VPQLIPLGFKAPVIPDGASYIYADCSDWLKDGGDADIPVKNILNQVGVSMVCQDWTPMRIPHSITSASPFLRYH